MKLKRFIPFLIFVSLSVYCFLGCPMESINFPGPIKLQFEVMNDEVKKNEPTEVIVRYPSTFMRDDKIFALQLQENVVINILEGTELTQNVENIIFIDFVRPDNETTIETLEKDLYPYCKLEVLFMESGIYQISLFPSNKQDFFIKSDSPNNIDINVTE
ncbi:MAG: hypothetical protein MJ188_06730 [Treponema sp.]|nr:hypothetical protein [Treponema sp.]